MRSGSDATRGLARAVIVSLFAGGMTVALSGARLDAAETTEKDPGRKLERSHVRFGDLYIAGMATLLPGGGTLEAPGGRPRVSAKSLRSDLLIPSGSLISTGATETARIRLGEKSLLRVNPNSALRIFSLHLELERGELCIQHGKTILPLRIQAASSTVVLERESAADFFVSGDGNMIVTVQAGTAKLQGRDEALAAGQRVQVKYGTLITEPRVAQLADWAAYSLISGVQEFTPRLGLEIESADTDLQPVAGPPGQGARNGEDASPAQPEPEPSSPETAPNAPGNVLQDHDIE